MTVKLALVLIFLAGVGAAVLAQTATAPATQPAPTTQPAAAKPDETVETPAHTKPLLQIDELTGELIFEGSYDQRRVHQETRDRYGRDWQQTNKARRFVEQIGLTSHGAIYGRDFLLFDIGVAGGLSQEYFSERRPGRDLSDDPSGSLFEYDTTFTLFPRGKLSATAYAKREDTRLPRAFLPSLDRTYERYGVDLLFNDRTFPMRLSYEHIYDELTSRTGDLLDDERRGRDRLQYEATWQSSPQHALRLNYQYDDWREQYSGLDTRYDTSRHYVTLHDTLRFGDQHRSSLDTLLRLQEETGDLARDIGEASIQLRLQHTKKLQTNYKLQYLREAFQRLRVATWRGEAGLTYQFNDHLTATLQGYGYKSFSDENADLTEWGGLASVSYNQKNALGNLRAYASYNYNSLSTDDAARRGIILAESVTLRDPQLTTLAQRSIDRGSILVTNAARTRTYVMGRDYMIIPLGEYTALRRIPTGNIADNQTVLVTYTYRSLQNYDVTRNRVDYRVQQDFNNNISVYYAGSVQDEDIDRQRYLRFRGRNVNRHRVGVTYRPKGWSVGGEAEYHDDAIDPYQALHFNADAILYENALMQLDGRTHAARYWFDGSDGLDPRNTTLVDAGLGWRYLLPRGVEAKAAALYRYENDSLFGDTNGVDLSASLEWKIGLFTMLLETEYDLLYLPDSRDDGFSVWLKLKRSIPIVSRK
jgi:hypothetical protein